ncbi:NAD-dependent epimerase/dehydratase family protein [Marivita sp. GX14005]|uniref:NAD-dependent epimerase/dehydratase family protein n=1 Tax=Marivita sp. GX14005 TaxID=2942276 RepID=UPI002019D9EF|nr:NAD-dependent epimerase/dehydratase family protein [Marivita sp. GX14005]MCL3881572.1 GDP-mannose 4,6-dehydratase [Marivita sp. GX14005]
MKRILITGTAGFIGYHLARLLLDEGFIVHGYDAMTDYYDVRLKERRNQMLLQRAGYSFTQALLEEDDTFEHVAADFAPDVIVHLAGQAGVRYSLENPRAYLDSNLVGTFNVMEAARKQKVAHLLMASTSSVYGANEDMPFCETDKADMPLTFYAATKKANEAMAHSYAHLWQIPTTMFRFFTVYGPWGRPDMALFKFTKGIFDGAPIDIYNHGDMYRDFTYVGDLVRGIRLLMEAVPGGLETAVEGDTLSPAAPYRVVNIGNSEKVRLLDFVDAIEAETGLSAKRNYMDMQKGDVFATWADASLLQALTGYAPQTGICEGVAEFVAWYRDYYAV